VDSKEIKDAIFSLAEKVGIKYPYRLVRFGPSSDGEPYIEFAFNEYCLVYSERGVEFDRKKTQDPDVLIFWILDIGVSEIAMEYELKNRLDGVDFRRIYFDKYLEIFSLAGEKWKIMAQEKVEEILLNHPYRDDI